MATTVGPALMKTTTSETFNHGMPRHLSVTRESEDLTSYDMSSASPQESPPIYMPPPNPHFVFPARSPISSAPPSMSRASGKRPRSVIDFTEHLIGSLRETDPRDLTPAALPVFSFNPGASLPTGSIPKTVFLSPPQSPSSGLHRPLGHGHRRGGSEFVGGSIRTGDTITIISTSPTKSDSGMASPDLALTRPARGRGHAHRRSAAISTHDLPSTVLPPSGSNIRGSSAPTSPATFGRVHDYPFPGASARPSRSEPSLSPTMGTSGPVCDECRDPPIVQLQQPPRAINRTRVGFSDTLEFIPRPLSLVSSDASSTVTVLQGHSVSGSISSIVSTTNTDRERGSPLAPSPARRPLERRPSTAGAVLERSHSTQEHESARLSPRRRGSIPYMGALPSPTQDDDCTSSPTKVNRWSFFRLEPSVPTPAASPTRIGTCSAGSEEAPLRTTMKSLEPSSRNDAPESLTFGPDVDATAFKPNRKRTKKPRKVKTWAGSILSRKSKDRHGKPKRRTPTPPLSRKADVEEGVEGSSPDMAPERATPILMVSENSSDGNAEAIGAPRPVSVPDEDTSYQMIDLDAALGPFNTPLPLNAEWEAAQRAGSVVKKQLHSAAGMSRFTGPGMHYSHRRAESAPEMAPFEAVRFGFHRFGSSSTMADVFEEDEEDEEDERDVYGQQSTTEKSDSIAKTPSVDHVPSLLIHAESECDGSVTMGYEDVPEDTGYGTQAIMGVKQRGSDDSCEADSGQSNDRIKSEHPASPLEDVGAGDGSIARPSQVVGKDLSSFTGVPRHVLKGKALAPVETGLTQLPATSLTPLSPFSMTQSSASPSPRSPMSYDAHQISTAPSSITEDNFQSLLMGEPGPELRPSVDVPSLASSNSTMNRESVPGQNPQARQQPPSTQPRPASFTSSAFGRRRSSLASLSRLINSSHGERSKLSMEVAMGSEAAKGEKPSKTKRFSRFMQFWKPKDSRSTGRPSTSQSKLTKTSSG